MQSKGVSSSPRVPTSSSSSPPPPPPSALVELDPMARLDVAMRDRERFTETVLNWTVSASVVEAKKSLATMQAELQRLMAEEENWRKQHNHSRGNLQEAWDKLVQLRTHITLFRSAIEEATIEDVSLQAESEAWRVAHPDRALTGRVPLTVDSAIKFGDVHGIREKLRLKEGLQRKVALVEELLADLRVQLSRHSTELTRVNSLGGGTYGSAAEAVGHSMVLRQAVISISHQLEDAEQDYLSARKELETVEIELSSILEKARTVGDAEDARVAAADASKAAAAEAARASNTEETLSNLVSAVLQGREPPPAITALTARVNVAAVPARCEFSLHEVLSGYARVIRLNGEEPRVYRARLEKRLSALMVLDQQLQDELLAKTEDVRRDRDRLREVEVLRLRVELQVTQCALCTLPPAWTAPCDLTSRHPNMPLQVIHATALWPAWKCPIRRCIRSHPGTPTCLRRSPTPRRA